MGRITVIKPYANVYLATKKLLASGMFAKPDWFDAVRRSPPIIYHEGEAPPTVTFPEDALFKTLLKKRPILELEEENPIDFQRSIAHRMARAQVKYMEEDKMSEEDALKHVETDFAPEIKKFEDSLDAIHESGARKLSFNTIKRNASQHARVSLNIQHLLEHRIDQVYQYPITGSPLEEKEDSRERRRAKLKRLANDPAIRAIKEQFTVKKPSVLRALEILVGQPDTVDSDFYNNDLWSYLQTLSFNVATHDTSSLPEAGRAEVDHLKVQVQEAIEALGQTKKKAHQEIPVFQKLGKEDQVNVLNAVQTALRLNIVRDTSRPARIRVSTRPQNSMFKVRSLQQELATESTARTPKEIMGSQNYGDHLEAEWWKESKERKAFLKYLDNNKELADD